MNLEDILRYLEQFRHLLMSAMKEFDTISKAKIFRRIIT